MPVPYCIRHSAPCCTFSQDTSLMAAGFSESYIRLWSLKGEKLTGYRSDFQSSAVKDGKLTVVNSWDDRLSV
jgi:transcription initiation factor TFIID subunit 5